MKMSKNSLYNHVLGLITFILGALLFIITDDAFYFVFGIGFLNLFWLIGIEHDVYKKEEKKKDA